MNDTGSAILIFSAKESKNGIPHSRHFRDDLTDFCPVLRAGTKADLEKSFRGRSSGSYGCFAAWRTGPKFYWKRYLNCSVGKSEPNEKGTLT